MTDINLKDLLEAGCHFGHVVRRWNPRMAKYIYGERDGVHIFDLAKTKKGLDDACEYLKKVASEGGVVLMVGTKRQAQDVVKEVAIANGLPYLTQRWLAGILTNFGEMRKRVRLMLDLKEKREKGELKKYTKREQLEYDREIAKLEKFFGGIITLEKQPAVLFVVDSHREEVAVREAVKMGVPVVAMVDTNANPDAIDYVIPANDDAAGSIELIVKRVGEAIAEGKKLVVSSV